MGHGQGNGVNQNDLPAHPPGIVHRRAGAAAPYPTVDGQQQASGFHQPVVPVDHAAVIVFAAYAVYRNGPFQNRAMVFP